MQRFNLKTTEFGYDQDPVGDGVLFEHAQAAIAAKDTRVRELEQELEEERKRHEIDFGECPPPPTAIDP